ncbi:MAG: hypothetical protein DME19_04635 [Verrucomicrobia bacterium]|nr:MAG: hypothetical protein DME19_04635 [Verrucomicrobiota bacterium]
MTKEWQNPNSRRPNPGGFAAVFPEIFCHLRFGLFSGFDIRTSGFAVHRCHVVNLRHAQADA